MHEPSTRYQSYLLRLWQDSPQKPWRAAAQSIQTREIVHFADLDALFAFLAAKTIPTLLVDCPASTKDLTQIREPSQETIEILKMN